jgi:tetratricopeptide (TPR) repeat protein
MNPRNTSPNKAGVFKICLTTRSALPIERRSPPANSRRMSIDITARATILATVTQIRVFPMNCVSRVAVCALALIALFGQDNLATLRGTVRDSHGRLVPAVTIHLKTGDQTLTAKSDSEGSYNFSVRTAGTYTLHAEASGQGETTFGPFVLTAKEDKQIDLTLAASKPDFYDQPTFIVAGVADSSNRGGHGSDTILRSSEALTKATASLGDLNERPGNTLQAAREYQHAAEQNPSERNLFDWGAELLAHRAVGPAIEVFTKGNRLFPRSTRMLLGLAVAFYANGSYDQAAQRFFDAADLNPSDPGPYLFLAKVQSTAITESDGYVERMARFAKLEPGNAWANFYYAASLWKKNGAADPETIALVETLLQKSLSLDPSLAVARLELGIVAEDQKHFPEAIDAFRRAIALDPHMEEAHYRLAQAYAKTGENEKAQKEFEIHHQLVQESSEEAERERRQIQQFVIELRTPNPRQ